jgi:hypothetical protein
MTIKSPLVAVSAVIWTIATLCGLCTMARFESTAGPISSPPSHWPSGSALVRAQDAVTLLVFIHPRCSCTDATLTQLEELLAWGNGRVQATIVIPTPTNPPKDWLKSANVRHASAIGGVPVVPDDGGVESYRFGALTSGVVAAYASNGTLLFAGGITPARAQTGPNTGMFALERAIEEGSVSRHRPLVFGCRFEELVGRIGQSWK